ncbi:UvrD-helicase domain-containing protein [Candidatus Electronema sp. PJ]|uniref:UvrD-helicase domain-containing protein n=1 Tax=Candidatus Electronema sp. PJ TaxID=3401572 RepID=UPI003AA8FC62
MSYDHKLYIADLHIHSLYSRATSKASTLHGLAVWAAIKGIDVVATGDFTHPGWFAQLCTELEPAEPGFFRLKQQLSYESLAPILPPGLHPPDTSRVRFVLSAEISSIYKRGGKVRKVHNLLYAPDLEAVRRINGVLAGIGNLESDGRPILGLDSQMLLAILLEHAPEGFLVPAHIWTPWFSLFGSKSGFESIEECFGDLSGEVFALETGLSSDPEMNRRISALDRFALISNSDCHSPSKLGREANIFAAAFDFFSLKEALRNRALRQFQATIEFYPEEGKYHCDGHRNCGLCFEPHQTAAVKGICPQCGKPLTIGVLYRVLELADRDEPFWPEGGPVVVHSLIPLPELLGELFDCGAASKQVDTAYGRLINTFGSEFRLLLETPLAEIAAVSTLLAEAIKRVREKRVICKPGFDGEFGIIKVFADEERAELGGQLNLFGLTPTKLRAKKPQEKKLIRKKEREAAQQKPESRQLNPHQQAAVESEAARIIVQAGPGTGKTHTLVQRAVRLLNSGQGPITVITFTNKAAEEIRQRLASASDAQVWVDTFHGFCLHWLRRHKPHLSLAGPEMRERIFKQQYPQLSERERKDLRRRVSLFLAEQPMLPEGYAEDDLLRPYFTCLRERNLLDLDEIVPACTALLHRDSNFAAELRAVVAQLLVDEFQDLNAAQYELVRLLAESSSVFAIGDPDQAIYGFRGANPTWFRKFIEEQRPECHQLTANYRSGAAILKAAAAVIAHNHEGSEQQDTQAATDKQSSIYRHVATTANAEARFIAEQIQQLIGGTSHREIDRLKGNDANTLALSDIAILCRTARQMPLIAQALADRTLPFQVVDLQPFYLSGKIKIIYYWILLAVGRLDQAELLFLLGQEEGIGAQALAAAEQVLLDKESSSSPLVDLAAADLPKQLQTSITHISERVTRLAGESPVVAVDLLLEQCGLNREEPELLRFRNMAASAVSLPAFAEHLRKYEDSVIYDERAEAVLLATLHAAKGLEFKAVFLAGCEEGLLPLTPRSELDAEAAEEHLAEERRLFFVGLTRAAETLYLCSSGERQGFAGLERPEPSRFLAEIPAELLKSPSSTQQKKRQQRNGRQLRLF